MERDFLNSPELMEVARRLTLARIKAMPDTLAISIGSQEYGKASLIGHVEEADAVGRSMMEMQVEFLRDLASGVMYEYA